MLRFIKKHKTYLLEGSYFLAIFFISQLPTRDYDIWFHIKSGEVFWRSKGPIFYDVFSHTQAGSEWIPYEWLFQVTIYLLSQIGMWVIPPFIALFSVLAQFFFVRILSFIFSITLVPRLVLSFVFFVSIYEFNTARPHSLAYPFIIVLLYLILSYVFKKRRWIFASPLLVLIWTNLHSTAFFSWGLPVAFALILTFQGVLTRQKEKFSTVLALILVSVANFLVTVSPPLGFLDYELLWTFLKNREFLGNFIAEWSPTVGILAYNPLGFYLYSSMFIVTGILFCVQTIKNKTFVEHLLFTPFFVMAVVGYSATRNIYLGTFAILIVLSACVPGLLKWPSLFRLRKFFWPTIAVVLVIVSSWLLVLKKNTVSGSRQYYPVQSAEFAKRYLKGKMFNDYTYGGYLLYAVYPQLQVFIDGRADVYVCCRAMQDYLLLALYKELPDTEYKNYLDKFWKEYDISFAILSSQKHNVLRLIGRHLSQDPDWALVFWDDDSQVFVKRDGKNDGIIKELEAKAATPYLREPFGKSRVEQALFEYERMDNIAKSARTSNAIGYLYVLSQEFDKAKELFIDAIDRDPTFESPYMNLGELAAKDQDLSSAINFYRQALTATQDRGLIYIRLGQLILDHEHDREQARKIWETGVKNTVDVDAREKLKDLLK